MKTISPQQEFAVATTPDRSVAATTQSLSVEQVFQAVIDKQISPENVEVIKKLLAMSAEQKFAAAFVALQSDLPTIVANTIIPNRGKYEKFEDVMNQIQPMLSKHGFTVSFSQDFRDNPTRIIVSCNLTHGGYTRSNSFAVRSSGKSDSETQADCKAATTAKRNALCQALNIVIRQDCLNDEDDAAMMGNPDAKITLEQADELERRVKESNSDMKAFLEFAKADSLRNIQANRYDELDALLRRKESRGK
ncbi:MAG: ERF family protein [Patescibacteria group bacterium]|nr:ERF family protein [Patescibacteria group bacterium]